MEQRDEKGFFRVQLRTCWLEVYRRNLIKKKKPKQKRWERWKKEANKEKAFDNKKENESDSAIRWRRRTRSKKKRFQRIQQCQNLFLVEFFYWDHFLREMKGLLSRYLKTVLTHFHSSSNVCEMRLCSCYFFAPLNLISQKSFLLLLFLAFLIQFQLFFVLSCLRKTFSSPLRERFREEIIRNVR